MKKFIYIFLTLLSNCWGYNYDDILIKTQLDIFPKIILLEQDFKQKMIDNSIVFTIVYHKSDFTKAKEIKKSIENKFQGRLKNHNFKIKIKNFDDMQDSDNSTAYYILNGNSNQVYKLIKIAQKNHKIVFSYEKNYFNLGSLISLIIKEEPYIYFNKNIIDKYHINFLEIFYQIVRFTDD